jgi:hypothetical protein
VQVRRDRRAELGERRVAVALRQVAQNLIAGAVFLDDVDDVLDLARGEPASATPIAVAAVAAELRRERVIMVKAKFSCQ